MQAANAEREDVTGLHEISVRTIRSTRATVSSLITELQEIKRQVEEAVRTGDLGTRTSMVATVEREKGGGDDGSRS